MDNIDKLVETHKQIVKEYKEKDRNYNIWLIPIFLLMLIPGVHYIGLVGIVIFIMKGFDITKKGEYSRGFLDGVEQSGRL